MERLFLNSTLFFVLTVSLTLTGTSFTNLNTQHSPFHLDYRQDTNKVLETGIYGSYADVSTYTELQLFDNHTFNYIDRFELGSTYKYSGKWKVKGKHLVLYDCENNTLRPMALKWEITPLQLCSKDNKKNMLCLKWTKKG